MSLETRVGRLEGARSSVQQPCGLLTVDITEWQRILAFRQHGYDLEPLKGDRPGIPRACADGIDFEEVRKTMEREAALRKKLEGRSRQEQQKIAKRHGYRIVYPPAGFKVRGE